MTSTAGSIELTPQRRPRLRLIHGAEPQRVRLTEREREISAERAALAERLAPVLVAGVDAGARVRMLEELRDLLPASTRFLEARETWEILARAAGSRMVVLTDDAGDVSTGSLVRLLGRRHPALPVLAVGSRTRASAPADADVATL